jgi:hypothetical protein
MFGCIVLLLDTPWPGTMMQGNPQFTEGSMDVVVWLRRAVSQPRRIRSGERILRSQNLSNVQAACLGYAG